MAARGWGGSVATAIGVAAAAGAAQLGFGYGLGIIAWLPAADGTSEAVWVASLTWATWIAATSTVAGAICAHRLSASRQQATGSGDPPPTLVTFLWRIALAVSSAIGGLITVVLVAVPARAAVRADTFSPQSIAAGYAVVGVMIGLLVAIWAITSPAVATNLLATVCWLWLLAVIAVFAGVPPGRGLASAQLGVWQLTSEGERFWFREYFYWPGATLSLGSALVIGALAARAAARRPAARVGAAISGISGPLLVAVAYFLAAPRPAGIRTEQVSAHLMAPYAVVAGLAGSALIAALAQRSEALAQHGNSVAAQAEPTVPRSGPLTAEAAPDLRPVDASGRSAGSGSTGGVGRSAQLPSQPVGGSRRVVDQADDRRVRDAGGPTAPAGSGTDAELPTTEPTTAQSDSAQPDSAQPDGATADGATGGATSTTDESATGEKPKSKLGRLGRRAR